MASVGSLSSSTSTNLYGTSIRGMSGLASGMDTDSLIEQMTTATRKKISQQFKERQKLQWKMDAYRNVSSQLIDFNSKFLRLTASNSLNRASTFDRNLVTTQGANASKVKVSGSSAALSNMQITSVKKLATTAGVASTDTASTGALTTGEIDLGSEVEVQKLADASLYFSYGKQSYSIFLDSSKDYKTPEDVVKQINEALSQVDTADNAKLGDKVSISYENGKFVFKDKQEKHDNMVALTGGSAGVMEALGFDKVDFTDKNNIGKGGTLTGDARAKDDLVSKTNTAEFMAGKEMTFALDGVVKTIKMPEADKLKGMSMKELAGHMQETLDKSFGKGRITVNAQTTDADGKKGSLTFGTKESTSILKVTGASKGMLGTNGILKINAGDANRLNLGNEIGKSGILKNAENNSLDKYTFASGTGDDKEKELYLEINGTVIKGLTSKSSISDIIRAVNDSDAGVRISYLQTADKFTITATSSGSVGKIAYEKEAEVDVKEKDPNNADGTIDTKKTVKNFASVLFAGWDGTEKKGEDAEFTVRYNGTAEDMTVVRSSNSFNFEGASFTLNDVFNTDPNNKTEAVTFSCKVDSEAVSKQVKEMVEAYNKMMDDITKQTGTKPNRKYQPLTDEDKAKMSEYEIKNYEDKAKEGLLFGDSLLRGMADKLRYVFTGVTDTQTLEKMGLTVSSSYSENGKITFDETKFKEALEQDPEKVQRLFTGTVEGKGQDGFMARMAGIYDAYAKTEGLRKGSLITRAGSTSSVSSLLSNDIQKQMDTLDDRIDTLTSKLQTEIDRYSAQFTRMEQLIAQMNNQSSMLGSFAG